MAARILSICNTHSYRHTYLGWWCHFKYGFAGLWYAFYAAWCAISAFVSTRIFRRSLAYSQAEWQTLRFGELGAEMLRGWLAGWQVFMNMFVLGWVGIAMGKLCAMLFGWDLWAGLLLFTAIGAVYVYTSGYWGVVMADFQQGVIALLVIIIVSVWGCGCRRRSKRNYFKVG